MGNYESGKINLDEPLYIFDYMFRLQPTPPLSSFNVFCLLLLSRIYIIIYIYFEKGLIFLTV
ncbi:hypothetical protein ACOSQ3_021271 [Xanthoceras sorbifolium]